ncbi:MAG: TIGR00341 family protein [Thermodesulfobacteriota bacterium]
MALRFLEITIPEEFAKDVSAALDKKGVATYWQTCGCDGTTVFKVILAAEKTESLLDDLEKRHGRLEQFRLVLVPVEASFPSPKTMEEGEVDAAAAPGERVPLRVSRQELYQEIFDGSRLSSVYLVMVLLATVVASIGLIGNNVAVIIGAMVIAPLLGPCVALSLAAALGDGALGLRAVKTSAAGIGLALGISLLVGRFLSFDPHVPEIAARTVVGPAEILLALASGVAGALAFTTGAPSALIGVMVAVALIPPLVTAGMLAGAGLARQAVGAALLLATNLLCVNIAGVATFLVQGIRPLNWWEKDRAKKATLAAVTVWSLLLFALVTILFLRRGGGHP